MKKRTLKTVALVALAGTMLQFGGCIGNFLTSFLTGLPASLLADFVFDNNAVLDLFTDN